MGVLQDPVERRKRVMSLKHKGWFFGGAALGLAIPFLLRSYEWVWMLGHVRPVVLWLFWPTSFLMDFSRPPGLAAGIVLFVLIFLGNALLYGLLAAFLRRAFVALIALLLIVVWILLPPSDRSLAKRFGEHRAELEQLVRMASSDVQLFQIRPSLIMTVDGKEHQASEAQNVLSQSRWAEYRRLFEAAGLSGLSRSPVTAEVFLRVHWSREIDPAGSSLGYLYCPTPKGLDGSAACTEDQDSAEQGRSRWKKLDSEWYIYEAFREYIIE
jgi:hypothetical protein